MGGVITRWMGERSTYEIPARYRVVLVERLGGLFSMVTAPVPDRWSFRSVPRRVSRGEYTCLCVRLGRRALNRAPSLSNGVPILVTAFVR